MAAALSVAFPTPPTAPRGTSRAYGLWWLPARVALNKSYDVGFDSSFFDTPHTLSFEPVTLALTLTREGSTLRLDTKVVRRDEPQHVIFSRTVTDRAAVDVAGDNGPPPPGPVAGVGLHAYNMGASPAEVAFDNLLSSADGQPMTLAIHRNPGRESGIEWPFYGGVLLQADALGGPWRPWPGVVGEDAGAYRTTTAYGGQTRFFRLASGEHYLDLFDTQYELYPRTTCSPVPGQSLVPGFALSAGHGRIRGDGTRNADFLLHYTAGLGGFGLPPKRDVFASVDIVDWDETMEDAAFGIVLRANAGKELWYPETDGLPHNRYAGMLTFKKAGSPSESVLSLTGPGGEVLEVQRFPAIDPAKQYRLRFGAVGDRLTLESVQSRRPRSTPIETCAATDGRVSGGVDAMYGTKSATETYDVTIDRFLLSGATR